jgi:hypothetical protein
MNLSTNYNVLQSKTDLSGIMHGTTLNQVQGIDNIFNRTARQFILDCDPQETIRIAQTPTLFTSVYDYPISNLPDLKGNKVIDIRPQVNRGLQDVFGQTYAQQFDVTKQYSTVPQFTIDFNTAEKSLRIDATDLVNGITLNNADVVSGNGTWVAGSNATALTTDNINYVFNPGSIQFNLSAGANPLVGNVYNSTMTPIDLTAHLNQSTMFWYVYLPTGSSINSVSLSWGSSSSNYWTVIATQNWQGNSFINGWNLIGVPWLGASQTGTPNVKSISYLNASFNYNGQLQTAVHLNQVVSNLGTIFQILYYSKYLFRDATTGIFQETVTADDNLINLDTDTFPVFFNLLSYYVIQQTSGGDAAQDMAFFMSEYQKGLARYQALYKSQLQKPQLNYYSPQNPSNQKYFGQRYP